MNAKLFDQNLKVGASPGTLSIQKDAPPPKIRVHEFSEKELTRFNVEPDDLESFSVKTDRITWIDVQGLGDHSVFEILAAKFGLHALLLEDIVNVPQRPKAEQYEKQYHVIVRMVSMDAGDEIQMEQVSFVVGNNYVISFQERYGDVFDPVRKRIENPKGRIRRKNANYLMYALIDTIVDEYYPILEAIGDKLEELEDRVINSPDQELVLEVHRLKNRLVNLRRGIWPQREALGQICDEDFELIDDSVRPYFRHLQHHCIQTTEVAEMYRELTSGLMNTYLSSVANRTNDVMKFLTIMATIFTPMTFLAGVYGMNFDHMPELGFWWAYPLIWALMILSTSVLLLTFWRKGWIGSKSR